MEQSKHSEVIDRLDDLTKKVLAFRPNEFNMSILNDIDNHLSCAQMYMRYGGIVAALRFALNEAGFEVVVDQGVSSISVYAGKDVFDVRAVVGRILAVSLWTKETDARYGFRYSAKAEFTDTLMVHVYGLPPTCRLEYVDEIVTITRPKEICDQVVPAVEDGSR